MPTLINIPDLTSSSPQKDLLRQFERIRCLTERDTKASVLLGALKSLLKVKCLKEFTDVKDIMEDFTDWYQKRTGDKKDSKKLPTKKDLFDDQTMKNIRKTKAVQATLIKDQGKLLRKISAIKQEHQVLLAEKRKQESKLKEFKQKCIRTNTGNYKRLKELIAGVTAAEMEILHNKDLFNEMVWRQKKSVSDISQLTEFMSGNIQQTMTEILKDACTKLSTFAEKYENSDLMRETFRKIEFDKVSQHLYNSMCSTCKLYGAESCRAKQPIRRMVDTWRFQY